MKSDSTSRRRKLANEMRAYFIDAFYLLFLLGTFAIYQRLLLAENKIDYMHYGITLIEALVLAKILFLGRLMHLDRGFENKPLLIPTVWKSFVFCLLVGGLAVVEALVRGLIDGRGATQSLHEFSGSGAYHLIGRCVVTFFALIPFFGLKEIGRILGTGRLADLFLRGKTAHSPRTDQAGTMT